LRGESLRAISLSPVTIRIEWIITQYANACWPMASNAAIVDILHGAGRETVRRSIKRLVLASRISIEIQPGLRRIKVLATGRRTDWGEWRTSVHAPYSRYAHGVEPPAKPVRLNHTPFRFQPQPLVPTRPAPVCQFITGEPDPAACNTLRICGRISMKGHSWCPEHATQMFPALKSKIKPQILHS